MGANTSLCRKTKYSVHTSVPPDTARWSSGSSVHLAGFRSRSAATSVDNEVTSDVTVEEGASRGALNDGVPESLHAIHDDINQYLNKGTNLHTTDEQGTSLHQLVGAHGTNLLTADKQDNCLQGTNLPNESKQRTNLHTEDNHSCDQPVEHKSGTSLPVVDDFGYAVVNKLKKQVNSGPGGQNVGQVLVAEPGCQPVNHHVTVAAEDNFKSIAEVHKATKPNIDEPGNETPLVAKLTKESKECYINRDCRSAGLDNQVDIDQQSHYCYVCVDSNQSKSLGNDSSFNRTKPKLEAAIDKVVSDNSTVENVEANTKSTVVISSEDLYSAVKHTTEQDNNLITVFTKNGDSESVLVKGDLKGDYNTVSQLPVVKSNLTDDALSQENYSNVNEISKECVDKDFRKSNLVSLSHDNYCTVYPEENMVCVKDSKEYRSIDANAETCSENQSILLKEQDTENFVGKTKTNSSECYSSVEPDDENQKHKQLFKIFHKNSDTSRVSTDAGVKPKSKEKVKDKDVYEQLPIAANSCCESHNGACQSDNSTSQLPNSASHSHNSCCESHNGACQSDNSTSQLPNSASHSHNSCCESHNGACQSDNSTSQLPNSASRSHNRTSESETVKTQSVTNDEGANISVVLKTMSDNDQSHSMNLIQSASKGNMSQSTNDVQGLSKGNVLSSTDNLQEVPKVKMSRSSQNSAMCNLLSNRIVPAESNHKPITEGEADLNICPHLDGDEQESCDQSCDATLDSNGMFGLNEVTKPVETDNICDQIQSEFSEDVNMVKQRDACPHSNIRSAASDNMCPHSSMKSAASDNTRPHSSMIATHGVHNIFDFDESEDDDDDVGSTKDSQFVDVSAYYQNRHLKMQAASTDNKTGVIKPDDKTYSALNNDRLLNADSNHTAGIQIGTQSENTRISTQSTDDFCVNSENSNVYSNSISEAKNSSINEVITPSINEVISSSINEVGSTAEVKKAGNSNDDIHKSDDDIFQSWNDCFGNIDSVPKESHMKVNSKVLDTKKIPQITGNITNELSALVYDQSAASVHRGGSVRDAITKPVPVPRRRPETIHGSKMTPSGDAKPKLKRRSTQAPPLPPRVSVIDVDIDNAAGRPTEEINALTMLRPLPSRQYTRTRPITVNMPAMSPQPGNPPKRSQTMPAKPQTEMIGRFSQPPANYRPQQRPLPSIPGRFSKLNPGNLLPKSLTGRMGHKEPAHDRKSDDPMDGVRAPPLLSRKAKSLYMPPENDLMCLLDVPLRKNGQLLQGEGLLAKHTNDLFVAAGEGRTDYVKTLLNQTYADLDSVDSDGWTPLHHACKSGNPETVRLLINRGADIGAVTQFGCEPLTIAILEKHKEDTLRRWHQRDVAQIVHELVTAGASVNLTDPTGLTAIMVALGVENNYTVDYLLDNGALVNYPLHLRSILHVITAQVSRGIVWLEIERKMLDRGANPNQADCCGLVPASLLFYSEFTQYIYEDVILEGTQGTGSEECEENIGRYEQYVELPSVLRLAKPNLKTFGYTRKRLARLLRHLRAGLDLRRMLPTVMIKVGVILVKEGKSDVLRLFHACAHYANFAHIRNNLNADDDDDDDGTLEEIEKELSSPTSLMQLSACTLRTNLWPNAKVSGHKLGLPEILTQYITLEVYPGIRLEEIPHDK